MHKSKQEKKTRKTTTTASTVLRVYCCGLAAIFIYLKAIDNGQQLHTLGTLWHTYRHICCSHMPPTAPNKKNGADLDLPVGN